MRLSNIVDNLSEEDAYEGYRKGIQVLENLYGVQTKEFEAAVAALKNLPVANDELKWMDLLCAVQMITNAAAREGVTELKKNTHALLFETIESKFPATHQGVYRNFVGKVIMSSVLCLSHVEKFIKRQTAASSHGAAPTQSRPQTQTQTRKIKTAQVTIEKKDDVTQDGTASSGAGVNSASSSGSNANLMGGSRACLICDVTTHPIEQCRVFKILTPQQCRVMVTAKRMCFLCLKKGHMIANCTSTQVCSECKGRHHVLLHQNRTQAQNQGQNQTQQRNRSDTAQGSNAQSTQNSVQGAAQKSSQPASANSAKTGQKTASINLARYLNNSVGDDNISLRTIPVFVCSEDGHETLVSALLDDGQPHYAWLCH